MSSRSGKADNIKAAPQAAKCAFWRWSCALLDLILNSKAFSRQTSRACLIDPVFKCCHHGLTVPDIYMVRFLAARHGAIAGHGRSCAGRPYLPWQQAFNPSGGSWWTNTTAITCSCSVCLPQRCPAGRCGAAVLPVLPPAGYVAPKSANVSEVKPFRQSSTFTLAHPTARRRWTLRRGRRYCGRCRRRTMKRPLTQCATSSASCVAASTRTAWRRSSRPALPCWKCAASCRASASASAPCHTYCNSQPLQETASS